MGIDQSLREGSILVKPDAMYRINRQTGALEEMAQTITKPEGFSLKSVLKIHTAESLAEDGTEFYFSGVTKEESGRAMKDGSAEIVYTLNLVDIDGNALGRTRIARLSIAEQLENAGVVGAEPEQWFGPVKIVKSGRTYRLEPTD